MAESTHHPLPKQPILPEGLIPPVFTGKYYEDEGFQNALHSAFAKYRATTQNPSLHKKYKSLQVKSDAAGDNSSSLLSTSRSYFNDQSSKDAKTSGEKDYIGYFILPPRDVHRTFEPNGHFETASIGHTHPALQQLSVAGSMMENYGSYQDTQIHSQGIIKSHYDGHFDTKSPTVVVGVSRNAQFGPDSTSPFHPVDILRHHAGPDIVLQDNSGDNPNYALHDAHYYLKFTDDFRDTLDNGVAMYDEELDILSSVLEEILEREAVGKAPMPFSIIVFARLEKLLKSLIDHPRRDQQTSQPNFRNAVSLAVTIQSKWHMRFQDRLFATDNEREIHMVMHGILARVFMQQSPKGDGTAEWVAVAPSKGAGTSFISFPLGKWWPNTACALRDGVVNLTRDKKVGSHQLVTYLTLLRGIETFDPESGCMIYEFEGRSEDVFLHLHEKVGKRIRLIRGYKLKSNNAPKIGIRYDGIHILRRYSLKLIDVNKRTYRVMLHYDAVKGESGIDKDFIKPSIKDDWELYKKIEKAEKKKLCSEACYNAWQIEEEREAKASQEWHRKQKFIKQAVLV